MLGYLLRNTILKIDKLGHIDQNREYRVVNGTHVSIIKAHAAINRIESRKHEIHQCITHETELAVDTRQIGESYARKRVILE